jgi:hypothetical protein
MISLYKEYLEQKLKEAGIKGKIYKTLKDLKASGASHLGAILFEDEKFNKDGSKKVYINNEDIKIKRVKKFERVTKLSVVIGDYTEEKCEVILSEFLKVVDEGLYDDQGNFVEMRILDSDWVEEKDSVLKSKIAVQVMIEFVGGVYLDTPFVKVEDIEVTEVEIE